MGLYVDAPKIQTLKFDQLNPGDVVMSADNQIGMFVRIVDKDSGVYNDTIINLENGREVNLNDGLFIRLDKELTFKIKY